MVRAHLLRERVGLVWRELEALWPRGPAGRVSYARLL